MKVLLLGAGSRKIDNLNIHSVVTLDNNPSHNPDVLWDLREHPLPFEDNEFDEVHAYEVLEHLAYQGDYEFFFAEFTEYARILKDGGKFIATVPGIRSKWAFGDPSHKRVIPRENLVFLDQQNYEEQVGKTSMSDFRYMYKANFKLICVDDTQERLTFVLEVKK